MCKNQTLRSRKPDYPIFMTSSSCLIFFYLGPLMSFSLFLYFKIPRIFQFSSCIIHVLKLSKSEHSIFSVLPNLIINNEKLLALVGRQSGGENEMLVSVGGPI
jgi:hypothetical protein